MVKWTCASSMCFNNFTSKDANGKPIGFYRLPRVVAIQNEYNFFFKTVRMNWDHGHICAAHWSNGRESATSLPDIFIPKDQYNKIVEKYNIAKETYVKYKNPSDSIKSRLKVAKQKFEMATEVLNDLSSKNNRIEIDTILPCSSIQKEPSKKKYKKQLSSALLKISNLKKKLIEAKNQIEMLQAQNKIYNKHKNNFKYSELLNQPIVFKYLCGLTVEQFSLLLNSVEPYTHLIPYPDCKNKSNRRLIDLPTELLSVLTTCRHGLNQGVMAYILNISKTTTQRIFIGWVIFLSTILNEIDLKPESGFLVKKMPKSFIETGHGLTDLIIDATEFKFQSASNFELNSLMFSNYKNTQTGKALIGIAPHGGGILFSDIYPGSISDSDLTEKSDTILFVEKDHEIMSDRGFSIQEFCATKGITLNRPKQKDSDQFSQVDVARNFDIASTRIHVERYIGRIRDWGIMNTVWPINRMDLLSSTWQMLAHFVNLTTPPIGPKK
jgi:hypothetical protein